MRCMRIFGLALLNAAEKPVEAVAQAGAKHDASPNRTRHRQYWFALAAIDVGDHFNARKALQEADNSGDRQNELATQIGWLLDLREEPVKALEAFVKQITAAGQQAAAGALDARSGADSAGGTRAAS